MPLHVGIPPRYNLDDKLLTYLVLKTRFAYINYLRYPVFEVV